MPYELEGSPHYEFVKSPHYELNNPSERAGVCSVTAIFVSPHLWPWFDSLKAVPWNVVQYQNIKFTATDYTGRSKTVTVARNRLNGSGGDPLVPSPATIDDATIAVLFSLLQSFGTAASDTLLTYTDDNGTATAELSGEFSLGDCSSVCHSFLNQVSLFSIHPGQHKTVTATPAAGGYTSFLVPGIYQDSSGNYWWFWGNGGVVNADLHAGPWASTPDGTQITDEPLLAYPPNWGLRPQTIYWCGSNFDNQGISLISRTWSMAKARWRPVQGPIVCTDEFSSQFAGPGRTTPQLVTMTPGADGNLVLDPTSTASNVDVAADASYVDYQGSRTPPITLLGMT